MQEASKQICRSGKDCTRKRCGYLHPCRYGLGCTRADCWHLHPEGHAGGSIFATGLANVSTTTGTALMNVTNMTTTTVLIKQTKQRPPPKRCHAPVHDVLFSFDTTGSMYACLEQVKSQLVSATTLLFEKVPGIRIGICAHGDYCDSPNIFSQLPFSRDQEAILAFIRSCPEPMEATHPSATSSPCTRQGDRHGTSMLARRRWC
jgi:hypothetical protein